MRSGQRKGDEAVLSILVGKPEESFTVAELAYRLNFTTSYVDKIVQRLRAKRKVKLGGGRGGPGTGIRRTRDYRAAAAALK